MERTVKEWFKLIPDKAYRDDALNKMINGGISIATSLANAIGHGINWGTTELGTALWSEYHSKVLSGEVKAISENKLFKIFN